jgi:hypothetical protein
MSLRSVPEIRVRFTGARSSGASVCQGSIHFAVVPCPASKKVALASRQSAWQEEGNDCRASAPVRCHRTAGGSRLVVGASRRFNDQRLGAAVEGSAGPVRVPAPERLQRRTRRLAKSAHIPKENAGCPRLARPVAMPRAMPNYSIERTRPGKPGRASHVKR